MAWGVLYKLGFVEKLTKEKKEALVGPMHLGIKCCANQNSKCSLQIVHLSSKEKPTLHAKIAIKNGHYHK